MFKIATYNANSIRMRLPQIVDWLARENPDAICIQETKVQDSEFPAAPIIAAGYTPIFRGQKSHAGVAILCKETPTDIAYGLDDGEAPDEPRLIRAVIKGISVVNTYVPQGRELTSDQYPYKLRWLARLKEFFARHYNPEQPLIWTGDLNVAPEPIDIYDPIGLREHVDFHPDVRAALEKIRQWGFVDIVRRHHPEEKGLYTYWDYRARTPVERKIGWRIDHIWATAPLAERSVKAWVDEAARTSVTSPSDHTFVGAEFDL